MAQILGCHLVGSVPFANAESVFQDCSRAMPDRLKRIPDGETGSRSGFTTFQAGIFSVYPPMMGEFKGNSTINNLEFTPEQIDEGVEALRKHDIETGYDDAAIESYAVFRRLRDEGIIKPGVKFQVAIPTTPNVIIPFVQRPFQSRVAPIYEAALFRALRRIQDEIPHSDLAIQIDLAVDTAFWEGATEAAPGTGVEWFQPWWDSDVKSFVTEYILKTIEQVDSDVEVGMHACYGDIYHQHWMEPKSLAVVVERGIRIMEAAKHPVAFFHCPVPKSAIDNLDEYLAPLRDILPIFEQQGTELYLGVVHEGRADMTKKMIEAASKVVPKFGVATECGGGRMTAEDFRDAMSIAAEVSMPIM